MGEVYAGRDSRLGRTIAVKVLSPRLGDDQDFKRRFLREARAVDPRFAAIVKRSGLG